MQNTHYKPGCDDGRSHRRCGRHEDGGWPLIGSLGGFTIIKLGAQ